MGRAVLPEIKFRFSLYKTRVFAYNKPVGEEKDGLFFRFAESRRRVKAGKAGACRITLEPSAEGLTLGLR